MSDTTPRALTYSAAAQSVGLSVRTLQRAIDRGDLNPVFPTGSARHPRLLAGEVDAWVNSWPDTPRE